MFLANNEIFLILIRHRDETFTEDINQTAEALSISRKYSSFSNLSTNSPQVHHQPYFHDPRQDNRFLNSANSLSNPSFTIPMLRNGNNEYSLPYEFSNMLRGHSSLNVRIREYEFYSINHSASTSALQQVHLMDNQLQGGFKAPLPPGPSKLKQSRSRAIEAPQHHEIFSRPQSAPPTTRESPNRQGSFHDFPLLSHHDFPSIKNNSNSSNVEITEIGKFEPLKSSTFSKNHQGSSKTVVSSKLRDTQPSKSVKSSSSSTKNSQSANNVLKSKEVPPVKPSSSTMKNPKISSTSIFKELQSLSSAGASTKPKEILQSKSKSSSKNSQSSSNVASSSKTLDTPIQKSLSTNQGIGGGLSKPVEPPKCIKVKRTENSFNIHAEFSGAHSSSSNNSESRKRENSTILKPKKKSPKKVIPVHLQIPDAIMISSGSSDSSNGIVEAKRVCTDQEKNLEVVQCGPQSPDATKVIKPISSPDSYASSRVTEMPTSDMFSSDEEYKGYVPIKQKAAEKKELPKATKEGQKAGEKKEVPKATKELPKATKELPKSKSSSSTNLKTKDISVKDMKKVSAKESKTSNTVKKVSSKHKESKSSRDMKQQNQAKKQESVPDQNASNKNQAAVKIAQNENSKMSQQEKSMQKKPNPPKEPQKVKPKVPEIHPADLLTLEDVSTAGSSMTTDDDDFFFSGGIERYKERHLNHRIKKLKKKKDELRGASIALKKNESPPDVKNKLKYKPINEESDNSTGDDDDDFVPINAVKKDTSIRVEERKRAEDRKKVEEQKKVKPKKQASKKVYEICDSDSSD